MDYYRQVLGLNDNEVFDTKFGDVNGDGIVDTVYILGEKPVDPNIRFIKNIKVVVQDGSTGKTYDINLKTNSGYNPRISLEKFSNTDINEILVSIDSGGSGGYGYFYVYSFTNNVARLLFDYEEFNNRYTYEVTYIDNYRVDVTNKTLNKRFLIELRDKGVNYLSQIYDPNGTLKKPTKGEVLGINNLYPDDINKDGIYELIAVQRVIGLYNVDTLGSVETPLKLENNRFIIFNDDQRLITYATEA